MTLYLLDANVFIQAKNLHYGFDFCPAFWDWVADRGRSGDVASISSVATELRRQEDELSEWIDDLDEGFFKEETPEVLAHFPDISNWAVNEDYTQNAVAQFLSVADFRLIAFALDLEATIVTHERAAQTPKKVKIPNVCAAFNIPCVTPYQMLRDSEARFVMEHRRR